MTNREKIEQLRGEFVRKTVAEIDNRVSLEVIGWENYPEPTHWSVLVDGKTVSGWCDQEYVVACAFSSGMIDNDTAIQLEIALNRLTESIYHKSPDSVW